MMNEVRMC